MRRTLAAALLACLCVPSWTAAQEAGDEPRLPLRAALAACGTGPTAEERFAVFTGSMPALVGTRRMAMRFSLQVRGETAGLWRPVRAKGFGRWHRSEPGRSGFLYTKRVERLDRAALYRVVVRFRWYDASGVQRTVTRRSRACRQPDQRPDLRVEALSVLPGPDASTARYLATVVNEGRGAAAPFAVELTGVDRDVKRSVAGLPPGERATVELAGPRCSAGRSPVVTVDPDQLVEESDERDNTLRQACEGR